MAQEGDVLICVVGATIGKLNLGIECAIGRSVAALRPDKKRLEQIYLYQYLKEWTTKLREQSQGSAQGVIGKDILNGIEIPLPSLKEQKEIVAEIERNQQEIAELKETIISKEDKIRSIMKNIWGVEDNLSMAAEPLTEYNQ
jgi:type I restriction enzyme S subunit